MLISVSALTSNLLALPESLDKLTGVTNFVNLVANFVDDVQAGPTGTPGILTYSKPPAIALLMTQAPVLDNSWVTNFANAIESGVIAGTITPGTVTNVAWTGSGTFDVATSGSPAATITTLAAAKALFISELLANVNSSNNPPTPLAQALHDYVTAFTFLCIGLGPSPTFTPIPIPFTAQ